MLPSQRWTWRSTVMIICARLFPSHGNSLSPIARLIDEYVIDSLDQRVLAEACEFGASPFDLDFLLFRTVPDWRKVVESAARGGHLHVFHWMRERQDNRGPWEGDFKDAMTQAARHGHLEIVKWLHERGLSCITSSALVDAANDGHLLVLKWLYKHTKDNIVSGLDEGTRRAAQRGHRSTVQWIYVNFKDADTSCAMAGAAENGDLELVQWLHQRKRCSEACNTNVMDAAVGGGNLCVVEWLYENCSKGCSKFAACKASKAGNLPMLQWLDKHYSTRFDVHAMNTAASEGSLETVKWLHEDRSEGCTAKAMNWAATNGHLDVVQWLHDNRTEGCTADAMDGAAGSGHLDVVKWLLENRSEGCTSKAMRGAARNGHLNVLRWLVELFPGKCRDDLMEIAAWEGHLDVVQYLGENTNQRASRWGLGAAAKQGWLKTLLVLVQNSRDRIVLRNQLNAVCKAFDKILTQLSYLHGTRLSSLWAEALESLELFHSTAFYSYVALMLEQALKRGCPTLVDQFMGHGCADAKRIYARVAVKLRNVVLFKRLLANGTPIDIFSAIEVGTRRSFGEYVEVTGYLSEIDRVKLVCEAITNMKWHKLLAWTLENTSFEDSSRATICNAIKQGPSETEQWLRESLSGAETGKWRVPFYKRRRVARKRDSDSARPTQ